MSPSLLNLANRGINNSMIHFSASIIIEFFLGVFLWWVAIYLITQNPFSRIPVKSVLDIGCGTALQLKEFARRGYKSIGLDLNREMLDFLEDKAKQNQTNLLTIISIYAILLA